MQTTSPSEGNWWGREEGQALVPSALILVVLMGAAGLAVDLGYLRYEQKQMQNAADAAAVAAAAELKYGGYVTSGQTDAARNGFTDGSNGVTVAINSPPTLAVRLRGYAAKAALHPRLWHTRAKASGRPGVAFAGSNLVSP